MACLKLINHAVLISFIPSIVFSYELSQAEMKETQGEWGPVGAFIGGVSGAGGYLLKQQIGGDKFSWGQLAASTGIGAASGALAGPVGVIWGGKWTYCRWCCMGCIQ